MMERASTKVCPLCAETIRSAAKVCPHCRHWQTKWSFQNPQVGVTIGVVLFSTAMICMGLFMEKLLGRGTPFADHRNELSIVSSEVSHRVAGSNVWVTVVGTLTNRSGIAWKDIGVEAQFLDKAGMLFDAITVNANDYRGVAVLPHGSVAFKVEGKAARPESDYQNCKVSVMWAKAADAWP
jgi:hypothetical protein